MSNWRLNEEGFARCQPETTWHRFCDEHEELEKMHNDLEEDYARATSELKAARNELRDLVAQIQKCCAPKYTGTWQPIQAAAEVVRLRNDFEAVARERDELNERLAHARRGSRMRTERIEALTSDLAATQEQAQLAADAHTELERQLRQRNADALIRLSQYGSDALDEPYRAGDVPEPATTPDPAAAHVVAGTGHGGVDYDVLSSLQQTARESRDPFRLHPEEHFTLQRAHIHSAADVYVLDRAAVDAAMQQTFPQWAWVLRALIEQAQGRG